MAVNPNTDFTAGNILTAAQQNRFPRGIMAYNTATATDSTVTAEEVQISSVTFTAVANRLYRLTYYEPAFGGTTAAGMTMRIRLTNISGTVQQTGQVYNNSSYQQGGIVIGYTTYSAGSVTLVATLQNSAGTGSAVRSSTSFAFLSVEDVGPY